MKLSIIIPYYNVKPYTDELLNCLAPQITPEVEVILIDDGSREVFKTEHSWVKVIRQDNGGVSKARNRGLEEAKGEYIAFIDADDLVSENYISTLFSKMPFDVLEMSWKSLPGGKQFAYSLTSDNDRLRNPSAVTRAFKRSVIGTIRFNENKQAAEDAEFVREIYKTAKQISVAKDFLYFYRTSTPNSLSKRYSSGDTETKRIVYHYKRITPDMTSLLDEVKAENEQNEVYVMTEQNGIPEIEQFAKVFRPCTVRGHELRGEPTPLFSKILPPAQFDIIIYTGQHAINGIYTWIKSFCVQMHDLYSIALVHEGLKPELLEELLPYVYVKRNGEPLKCQTLLMMRITDSIPLNIRYKKSIQIVHAPHLDPKWVIPSDRDEVIPVSEVVRKSWNLTHEPIHNMTAPSTKRGLRLISATRLNTPEKGLERMRALVQLLRNANIPYSWACYSETDPHIDGIIYQGTLPDVRDAIRRADYLVQLSDNEGFCYSIVEALEEGTAVLTTPLDVLPEIGFHNKTHGYIIPFDMNFDITKIKVIPQFEYTYDNSKPRKAWEKVLGKAEEGPEPSFTIKCVKRYRDMTLDKWIEPGEQLTLNKRRAEEILSCGYAIKTD